MDPIEAQKRAAAEEAADLVEDGMAVGLGSGSTVAHFLAALAHRAPPVRCVAASPRTRRRALELGLPVEAFDDLERLDLAVDGADQVDGSFWLVKGEGGAHTRERIVAAAAQRFVVIVSSDKPVERLGPPIPLELLPFGIRATLRHLGDLGPVELRDAAPTPDGNLLADYRGPVGEPTDLVSRLDVIPGVVDHGLFPPDLVDEVLVGRPDGRVERLIRVE